MNLKNEILKEIGKVIVGKNDAVSKVLTAILAGGHILLEDIPGVGKTTLALAFSKALGLDYRRIQFTSDTMPSDVTGFSLYNKAQNAFVYQPGPVMTNLLLADEINRTSSKTQAALLEAMEEKNVTVDGKTYPLPNPFVVLATQNPVGSAGTQMLPSSQLDRFMIRLTMGYPDFKSQINILKERHLGDPLDSVEQIVNKSQLLSLQQEALKTYISDPIYEYITRLAEATREHSLTELGLSPRGALAACRFVKAYAYLNERDYVVPQDVREVFCDIAAHRLVLSRKAKISERTEQSIIAEILAETPMPSVEIKQGEK